MRRDRLQLLFVVLLVLLRTALGTGALHDHLAHEGKPDTTCVTCGAASLTAHVPTAPELSAPPVAARIETGGIPFDPLPRLVASLDARAPPARRPTC